MGAVDMLNIRIKGRGGHAAQPHNTIDPFPALAGVIQAIHGFSARGVDPFDSHVVSLCAVEGGFTHNVIPEQISLIGTVRTLDEGVRDHIEERLRTIITQIAAGHGCIGELDYTRSYPVLINHTR